MQPTTRLAAAALLVTTTSAFATPSGLNNIPTADTAPQGTAVFQAFSTVGNDRHEDFNLGFKTGVDLRPVKFEFGLDSHILPDDAGPLTVQGKVAVPFGDNLPTLGLGIANTTFSGADRDKAGDPFSYLVLSHDFGFLRGHAGVGFQDDTALPFFGFDKTFRTQTAAAAVAETSGKGPVGKGPVAAAVETVSRDLFTLRADAIQQQDSSWVYSAGVLVPVVKHVVFETWGSFPDNGDDPSLTLKLNFVFSF